MAENVAEMAVLFDILHPALILPTHQTFPQQVLKVEVVQVLALVSPSTSRM